MLMLKQDFKFYKLSSTQLNIKALLQRAKKLRESLNFKNVYIQPALTKSEREMQFKLREEKRRLQAENPRKKVIQSKIVKFWR